MDSSSRRHDPLDLDAYLERIAYSGPLSPSLDVMTEMHEAHLAAIPFENLDILLGRPISLELEALQRKMIAGRRGGYCFEHNTLFQAVLELLGFRVTLLAARVRAGTTTVRPRTHMLLRASLPAGDVLADVGFGGDGFLHPLPLVPDVETWRGLAGHRLRREGDTWVLTGNVDGEWADLYAFTLEPHYPVDFVMANHFTSTYPSSAFVRNLTVQGSWADRRVLLRNRDLVIREAHATRTTHLRDPDHLLEVLRREFGLSFPPGTRFQGFGDAPAPPKESPSRPRKS